MLTAFIVGLVAAAGGFPVILEQKCCRRESLVSLQLSGFFGVREESGAGADNKSRPERRLIVPRRETSSGPQIHPHRPFAPPVLRLMCASFGRLSWFHGPNSAD